MYACVISEICVVSFLVLTLFPWSRYFCLSSSGNSEIFSTNNFTISANPLSLAAIKAVRPCYRCIKYRSSFKIFFSFIENHSKFMNIIITCTMTYTINLPYISSMVDQYLSNLTTPFRNLVFS